MATKRKNKTSSIVVIIVLIVLFLFATGAVVMVVRNYGAGSTQTSEFAVSYGETVLTEKNKINLAPGQPLSFNVNVEEYDVKVVPKRDAGSFYFVVDGENVKLKSIKDYSAAFKVAKTDDGFSISAPADFAVFASKIFPDKTVTCVDGKELSDEPYFALQVKSGDDVLLLPLTLWINSPTSLTEVPGGSSVEGPVIATGLTLDKSEVIF